MGKQLDIESAAGPAYVSTGHLPPADLVQRLVTEAHARFRSVDDGQNAGVYPALAEVPPGLFGICVVGTSGMVFPAVYLGTVVGVATPLLVSGTTSSPLVAAGIAAAVAGVLRLPFTGVLLALLLCAAAGLTVTTSAIIGSVIGVLVRVAADMRLKRTDPQPATEPA